MTQCVPFCAGKDVILSQTGNGDDSVFDVHV